MHLLILGATGPSGILLTRRALSPNEQHTVVLYCRSPDKLPDDITNTYGERVRVVKGELEDTDALSAALTGVHAVLSALGPTVTRLTYPSNTPLAHAYEHLLGLMRTHDVKRLIALGTPTMPDRHDRFSLKWRLLINGLWLVLHNVYRDVVAMGETIRGADGALVWTLVRVPLLTNEDKTEVVAGYAGDGKTGTYLARRAFAEFMVHELETNEWVRKAPIITSS